MKRDIKFISKQYNWGWSVWITVDNTKLLLADKLKSQKEVSEFINSLSKTHTYEINADEKPNKDMTSLEIKSNGRPSAPRMGGM